MGFVGVAVCGVLSAGCRYGAVVVLLAGCRYSAVVLLLAHTGTIQGPLLYVLLLYARRLIRDRTRRFLFGRF